MLVFSTYCESHTSDVAFQAANRLLRSGFGVEGSGRRSGACAAAQPGSGADSADLILLQDELGIRDPADELPDIAPEARRRRVTALVNAAVLAPTDPALYIIEDAHWIDPTSEALLAEFLRSFRGPFARDGHVSTGVRRRPLSQPGSADHCAGSTG